MAFSSSVSRFCGSHIFASFYEPDVSNTFISHFRKQLEENLIFMFDNQEMKGSPTIAHALTHGIRESRISIVVLSKNYASSSWCLDELVEILKSKEDMRQIVMTVFYGVDPSHVRKSTGDFGIAFDETCARKPEESRRIWNQALNDVGNIAGEVRENWADESEMIAKIVRSVSNELHGNWLDLGVGKGTIITKGDKNVWQRKKKRGVNFPSTEPSPLPRSEPSISTKSRYSIGRVFLAVIINLLLEIASAVADQLSSFRKPYFARISLVMSILSLILSILDFTYKIRADKARFRCKWPMPWFYYPSRGYNRIFGSSTDAILLFCGVGSFIVSTINFSFTGRGRDGPIKVSVWPLVFSVGMVVSKIMEKSPQSEELV